MKPYPLLQVSAEFAREGLPSGLHIKKCAEGQTIYLVTEVSALVRILGETILVCAVNTFTRSFVCHVKSYVSLYVV